MQLTIASVVGLLATTVTPALASTPLVPQIQQIALETTNVRDKFNEIELMNSITQAPMAINAYQSNILKPKTAMVSSFPSSVEAADQAALCENYFNFATATEDLLNALIGKEPVLAPTNFFKEPVLTLLRQDEALTAEISHNVVGVASSCAEKIKDPKEKLEKAYIEATNKYSS